VPDLIAIFGPTGVGKTAVTLALAERLRARREDPVAVSADALQVYAGLETLTGAPTAEERRRLEHRLVGIRGVSESFSVGEFMPLVHAAIDEALAAGRRPIVVGGTGLYLRAALTELDLRPPPPDGLRERIEAELAAKGPAALHAELAARAPALAAGIAAADRSRIVRALELLEMGEDPDPGGDQLWASETRVPTLLAGIVMQREELYARIDARVDTMLAAGAAEEVRRAEATDASRTARKALGYAELLAGDVEAMKRRTRNYAKRQLTWMRKLAGVRVIDATGRTPDDVAEEIAAGA
jgi:tRNA dimethylallyltransferase